MKYKYKCCLCLFIILLILMYNSYRKRYYIIKNNFLDINFIDNIYNTIISDKKWIYTTNIGKTRFVVFLRVFIKFDLPRGQHLSKKRI